MPTNPLQFTLGSYTDITNEHTASCLVAWYDITWQDNSECLLSINNRHRDVVGDAAII